MAKLTAKKRAALPAKDFALPGRRFPISDKQHARAALQRVSMFGTPAEKAAVRKKVAVKFPDVAQSKGPQARKTGKGKKKTS